MGKKPIECSIFSGTSVGAYNAAFMVSRMDGNCYQTLRQLRKLWLDRIASVPGRQGNSIFRFRGVSRGLQGLTDLPRDAATLGRQWLNRGFDLSFSNDHSFRRWLRLFDVRDIISVVPLRELVSETIDFAQILHPQALGLMMIASNWDNGNIVVFQNRPPIEAEDPHFKRRGLKTEDESQSAILASAAIPALFPKVRIGNDDFVDGGLLMNTPLDPVIESGATVLHVIHLEPNLETIPFGHSPSLFETLERVLVTVPANNVKADIEYARKYKQLVLAARSLRRQMDNGRIPIPASSDREREDGERVEAFIDRYAEKSRITIHRYYPQKRLGGIEGLLDFDRDRLIRLIELGFQDAVEHDCQKNRCVL